MKLEKYEIDAIVNKITSSLKEEMKIPSFKKELDIFKKVKQEYETLNKQKKELDKKFDNIDDIIIDTFDIRSYLINTWDEEGILSQLKDKYLSENMPTKHEIINDIVFSQNKDLNDLVKELIKKYKK